MAESDETEDVTPSDDELLGAGMVFAHGPVIHECYTADFQSAIEQAAACERLGFGWKLDAYNCAVTDDREYRVLAWRDAVVDRQAISGDRVAVKIKHDEAEGETPDAE